MSKKDLTVFIGYYNSYADKFKHLPKEKVEAMKKLIKLWDELEKTTPLE